MIGNEGVGPGVMVLTMRDIFKQIEERKESKVRYFHSTSVKLILFAYRCSCIPPEIPSAM